MSDSPAIQLITNLVVVEITNTSRPRGADRRVLLALYRDEAAVEGLDTTDETVTAEQPRWWLPAGELDPYQHPDDVAKQALEDIGGLSVSSMKLARVQSFRGRRGWHISFDYLIEAGGNPGSGSVAAAWHTIDDLPPTMHGNWERDTIESVAG
jgi:ADP-ribose pyrophosphatase YjhB (NUDIX family)